MSVACQSLRRYPRTALCCRNEAQSAWAIDTSQVCKCGALQRGGGSTGTVDVSEGPAFAASNKSHCGLSLSPPPPPMSLA
eukprot:363362-Chlamydomonas_euryale.AAC.15